jgi:hypothetical protein
MKKNFRLFKGEGAQSVSDSLQRSNQRTMCYCTELSGICGNKRLLKGINLSFQRKKKQKKNKEK